tara:strand:+ start:41854 stop:42780 length:927 start_codon:yes stop_codon:yes gene_type:complete
MNKDILHITNGNHLTDYLKDLEIEGAFLTWQEMLCEGPTLTQIDSQQFIDTRKDFLKNVYTIDVNEDEIKNELAILNNPDNFSEIVLWFEFDLFCHINLLGVIKLLQEKHINLPIFLVCSGRIEGEKNLKGLSELTSEQLLNHYDNKVRLLDSDLDLARTIWHIYCGKDHNLLKPFILKNSSFIYLNSCLKAHLKRFPNLKNGLNVLEENILSIIRDKDVKSKGHLIGYALNFQGYYGYGDIQILRIIDLLAIFYEETETRITLNRKGHEALIGIHNFASEINDTITFGGINRMDYYFSTKQNELIKK